MSRNALEYFEYIADAIGLDVYAEEKAAFFRVDLKSDHAWSVVPVHYQPSRVRRLGFDVSKFEQGPVILDLIRLA